MIHGERERGGTGANGSTTSIEHHGGMVYIQGVTCTILIYNSDTVILVVTFLMMKLRLSQFKNCRIM